MLDHALSFLGCSLARECLAVQEERRARARVCVLLSRRG
jgi:hypothetical protein